MQKPSNSYASTKVDYIDALTKEIGRYFVVLKLALPKAAYTDVTWGSATIPANTLVFLRAGLAIEVSFITMQMWWRSPNVVLDSDLFAEPDVFAPERWRT